MQESLVFLFLTSGYYYHHGSPQVVLHSGGLGAPPTFWHSTPGWSICGCQTPELSSDNPATLNGYCSSSTRQLAASAPAILFK